MIVSKIKKLEKQRNDVRDIFTSDRKKYLTRIPDVVSYGKYELYITLTSM